MKNLIIIVLFIFNLSFNSFGFDTKEKDHDCNRHANGDFPGVCSKCETMPVELGE